MIREPVTIETALRHGYLLGLEYNAEGFEAQLFFPGCRITVAHANSPLVAMMNLETEMGRLGWPQIERRRDALTKMREPELWPAENGAADRPRQGRFGILLHALRNAFRR